MAKDVDVTIVANLVNGVVEFEMEEGNQYTEMLIFNKTKDKLPK